MRIDVEWGVAAIILSSTTTGCFNVSTDPSPPPPMLNPTTTDADTGSGDGATSSTPPDTGPATTSLDSSTGNASDPNTGGTTDGDESTASDSSTGADITATIYEIQDGTVAEGAMAAVSEVLVTAVDADGFYAQELPGGPFSGLFVFTGSAPTVARGDEVDLMGTVVELDQMTSLDTSGGSVTPTGVTGIELAHDVVALADLSGGSAEDWEGVLVQVVGASLDVSAVLPEFFTVAAAGDFTDVGERLFDVPTAPEFPNFGVGASFTAVGGVFRQGLSGYRILPRDALDLEGYDPVLTSETFNFPSPGDTSVITSGTLPWNVNDYFEGVRATSLPTISSIDIHIDIISNGLSDCGFQNADVSVNGTTVGSFTVAQGTVAIDDTFPIAPAIAGPNYTVRYQTTATVASGCGAAGYSEASSTVTFHP